MNKHKTCWPEQKQETFYECNPNYFSVEERILSYLWYIYSKKKPPVALKLQKWLRFTPNMHSLCILDKPEIGA